ncbi:hypothetical protein ACFPL7_19615 [Dongia soli]|uniref:Uncharacterized protein n=1 Tax=Dongia soli TaxID=600628 RepID=A0ABU5E6J1_9PROT|nr:hypothetical protein [Dongia soli]MDY0881798.1 hypothetical protein [Dongia soli]
MLFLRLLALAFAVAAVVFGAIQLADRLIGTSEPQTLIGLWQRTSPGSLTATQAAFASGDIWGRLIAPILGAPAWIFCMALALLCWLVAGLTDR